MLLEVGAPVPLETAPSGAIIENAAVTDLLPFITIVLGLSVPLRSPLQPAKFQPLSAMAFNDTSSP